MFAPQPCQEEMLILAHLFNTTVDIPSERSESRDMRLLFLGVSRGGAESAENSLRATISPPAGSSKSFWVVDEEESCAGAGRLTGKAVLRVLRASARNPRPLEVVRALPPSGGEIHPPPRSDPALSA